MLSGVGRITPSTVIVFASSRKSVLKTRELFSGGTTTCERITGVPLVVGNNTGNYIRSTVTSRVSVTPAVVSCFKLPVPGLLRKGDVLPRVCRPSGRVGSIMCARFAECRLSRSKFNNLRVVETIVSGQCGLIVRLLSDSRFCSLRGSPCRVGGLVSSRACARVEGRVRSELVRRVGDAESLCENCR